MIIIWGAYLYYNSCLKSSKRPFPLLFHFAILNTINSALSKILEDTFEKTSRISGGQVEHKMIMMEGWKSREDKLCNQERRVSPSAPILFSIGSWDILSLPLVGVNLYSAGFEYEVCIDHVWSTVYKISQTESKEYKASHTYWRSLFAGKTYEHKRKLWKGKNSTSTYILHDSSKFSGWNKSIKEDETQSGSKVWDCLTLKSQIHQGINHPISLLPNATILVETAALSCWNKNC